MGGAVSIFTQLQVILEDPYIKAKEEKDKGKKVIGITPMHFPEELIHASGALPVILQESNEPITTGWAHIFPNFCAFTRSNVDWAVKGKLDFLDAIVISDICLQTRMAFGVMSRRMAIPFIYMWWPLEYDMRRWHSPMLHRMKRCQQAVQEVVGRTIEEKDIQRSIELYNHNRQLLREIYKLRYEKPGVLKTRHMLMLVMSSMIMPKEEHNDLLHSLIPQLKQAPARDGIRIFLSGHLCHGVKPDILDLIEDMGAVVVGDDLYIGYRYFAAQPPTNVPPLEALLWRYFDPGVPCPSRCGPEGDWAEHIIGAVKESRAQGVISLIPKFCEAHMFYYPYLADRLTKANIPYIFFETEHEMVSLEGFRTRVQALIETIKGGKGWK